MKVTLTANGKSIEVNLTPEQCAAIGLADQVVALPPDGYAFESAKSSFFADSGAAEEACSFENYDPNPFLEAGNYYTDKNVADQNVRADNLMRSIRRFAELNHCSVYPSNWDDCEDHYIISYDVYNMRIMPEDIDFPSLAEIVFTSKDSCLDAIETFYSELAWYFQSYLPRKDVIA